MQDDREVVLLLRSRGQGPIVRDGDVQDPAELRGDDLADLFDVIAPAEIGRPSRNTEPAQGDNRAECDEAVHKFHG